MSADNDTTGLDPSKVRGVEIRVECFHCSGSGRVRAGKEEYERNGEMLSCPVCGGTQTTRKLVSLSALYDLLFGNLKPLDP